MENQELGMYSKEVALNLDISTSNLRKWSMMIESMTEYKFTRQEVIGTNAPAKRIYYQRDIEMLMELQSFLKKDRNIEKGINIVTTRFLERKKAEESFGNIKDLNKSSKENVGINALKPAEIKDFLNDALSLALQEDQVTRKKESIDDWITRQRIEQQFRAEAIELWEQKPDEERFITSKFLGIVISKQENAVKRDDFIKNYLYQKIIEEYQSQSRELDKVITERKTID